MYKDFYPCIPGSLDAKQRMRKRRLKHLGYGVGAVIMFSSGFLVGLVWYEPEAAPSQAALQLHRPMQLANPLPDEPLTPPIELAAPSPVSQPIPLFEPASLAALHTDVNVSQPLAQADASPRQQTPPLQPYLVQIGAFRNEANARRIVAKLRGKGYQPFIRKVPGRQNHVLHLVFLDRAEDKAQAQATAKAFEEAEKMDTLVMLAERILPSDHRNTGSR